MTMPGPAMEKQSIFGTKGDGFFVLSDKIGQLAIGLVIKSSLEKSINCFKIAICIER